MKKKDVSFAQQVSVKIPDHSVVGVPLDPETRDDLKDKKHLLAVKKSREQYKRGEFMDTREFLKSLK